MERTLYDILGVAPNAPPESVRAAYIDSIQAIGAFDPDAERLHGDLREAFEVLIDPEGRRHYDQQILLAGRVSPDQLSERYYTDVTPDRRVTTDAGAEVPVLGSVVVLGIVWVLAAVVSGMVLAFSLRPAWPFDSQDWWRLAGICAAFAGWVLLAVALPYGFYRVLRHRSLDFGSVRNLLVLMGFAGSGVAFFGGPHIMDRPEISQLVARWVGNPALAPSGISSETPISHPVTKAPAGFGEAPPQQGPGTTAPIQVEPVLRIGKSAGSAMQPATTGNQMESKLDSFRSECIPPECRIQD